MTRMWRLAAYLSVFGVMAGILLGFSDEPAVAAINSQIPFYGTLKDSSGNELSGTYDMVFRFYDAPTGGTLLDTSTHTAANGNAVTVSSGEFNVLLGSGTGNTLNGLDFDTDTIYVGLSVEGDSEMTPRERLGAAPYAFNTDTVDGYHANELLRYNATGSIMATSADTLFTITQNGGGDILNIYDAGTEVFTVLDGGNVGIGTTSPTRSLTIAGDLELTGAFYDTNNSAGTSGFVLQSTASGTQWVATSSLGITGGGSSLFTDGGATTYLTATTDQLALGTTTAPSGTKLYVEGGGVTLSPGAGNVIGSFASSSGTFGCERKAVPRGGHLFAASACHHNFTVYDVGDPTGPGIISTIEFSDFVGPVDFVIVGKYAYLISNSEDHIMIVDISEPNDLRIAGTTTIDIAVNAFGIDSDGSNLYIAHNGGFGGVEMYVFDLYDPENPRRVTSVSSSNENLAIRVEERYAYMTVGFPYDGVSIWDIADPAAPSFVGSTTISGGAQQNYFEKSGNLLYIAAGNGLSIVNVADPSSPLEIAYLSDPILTSNGAIDPVVSGHYVYMILATAGDLARIFVGSSTDPYLLGTTTLPVKPYGLNIQGDLAYISGDLTSTDDLVVVRLDGFTAPAATVGSLLSDRFDSRSAYISRLLTIDGSIEVRNDTLVSGALLVGGAVAGVRSALSVDGEVLLSAVTPATTTNALYNQGGALYFNGSLVGGGTTDWSATGTDLYFDIGNVAVGTTSISRLLTIDGDLQLTDALFDATNNAGSVSEVLSASIGGAQWVASTSGAWFTAASNYYWDLGSVGVGTSSPNTSLTIEGAEDTALLALADSTNGRQANIITGASSPNGRLSAPTGSLYLDTLRGRLYQKASGGGTTWQELTKATAGTFPRAKLIQTTAQTLTHNDWTTIDFDVVAFDTDGMVSTTSDSITIKKGGTYIVFGMVSADNYDDGDVLFPSVTQNGTRIHQATEQGSITNFNLNADIEGVFEFSAGDQIGLDAFSLEGADQSTNVSTINQPFLAVVELPDTTDGLPLFTDAGTTTYLTSLADNLAIGTSTSTYKTSIWGDLFIGTSSEPTLLVETGSGRVGIGTSTFAASSTLTVDGTITASNLFGGAVNLTTDANGNIIRDPSDARLKTNITGIEDALETVLQLRGVRYNWKDTARFGSTTEIGFIAQEVDLILPEVVRKGGAYWSLNTRNILAVVVEAVQDLWQLVSGNEAYITELEDRVEVLEAAVGMATTSTTTQIPNDADLEGTNRSPDIGTGSTTASSTSDQATSTDPTASFTPKEETASTTPDAGSGTSIPEQEESEPTASRTPEEETQPDEPLPEEDVSIQPASTTEPTELDEEDADPVETASDSEEAEQSETPAAEETNDTAGSTTS